MDETVSPVPLPPQVNEPLHNRSEVEGGGKSSSKTFSNCKDCSGSAAVAGAWLYSSIYILCGRAVTKQLAKHCLTLA